MELIKIITSTEMVRVRPEDVVYLEASGNYSNMVLNAGIQRTLLFKLSQFDNLFSTLRNNPFVRVGRHLIINKRYIFLISIPLQEILLAGSGLSKTIQLKASKDALKELKEVLTKDGGQEQ